MFFKSMFPVVGRGGTYLISGIGLAGLTAATAGSPEDGADNKSKFIGIPARNIQAFRIVKN